MEQTKLISVIVPVHNSQDTLERCVQSIVGQTYKNIEIILIENGSTDNSLELCKRWAEKDARIVVDVSEKGVSKARNLGLSIMKGEYFAFVDADDYIADETYEKLIEKAEEENADMTFCMTNSVYMGKITEYKESMLPKVVHDKDIRWFFYRGERSVRTGTIRTLFKSDKFGDVRYDEELCYSEDFLYMLECMDRADKCSLVEDHLYYNVNFHGVPFLFAKKYKGRHNFFESARIFAEKSEKYLEKYGCDDIRSAPKFDGLILLINAIVGTEKHWLKEVKKFCKIPFWKEANNKEAYKQYLTVVADCSFPVKLKAFLVRHRMYVSYYIAAMIYAALKG